MYEVRSEFQDIETSFAVFLKDAEKAKSFTKELQDYAWYNMFEFSDLTKQASQLLAFGNSVKDVIPILDKLSNIAAGTHGNLGELVALYNKAKNIGSVDARSLQSWAAQGVVVNDILKEMGEKTEGTKVSFKDLDKALNHITSEGGRFYKLMEAEMDNLSASWGQLQDDVSIMFNELGTSMQDILKGGVETLSKLVQNYEQVGKAIATLIGIYGAEKVAVAAITVARTAQTMATNGYTAAEIRQYHALLATEKAQKLLNATILKNPYVLAAAALTVVTMAIIKHTRAENSMNEAIGETTAKIQQETGELDRLFAVARNENASKQQRAKAIDTINARYGDYLDNLLTEKDSVEKLTGAYKNLSAAITEKYLEEMREQTVGEKQSSYNDAETDLWAGVKKIVGKSGLSAGRQGAMTREMQAWIGKYSKYNDAGETYHALLDIYGKYGGSSLTSRQQGNLYKDVWNFKDTQYELSVANKEFTEFANGYNSVLQNLKKDAKTETTFTTMAEELKAAREELAGLKKEESDLRAGKRPADADSSFTFESALADNAKKQKEAQGKIDTLTGTSAKTIQKNATEEQKAAQKTADAQYNLDKKRLQERIADLQREKEGEIVNAQAIHALKMQLIDLEEAHQLAALDREISAAGTSEEKASLEQQKAIVSASAGLERSSLEAEDKQKEKENLESKISTYLTYSAKRRKVEEDLNRDLKILQKARDTATADDAAAIDAAIEGLNRQKFENSGLSDFETYEEKRAEIQKQYADLRLQAEAEGNAERLRLINQGEEEAISALNAEQLQASMDWQNLFQNLDYMAASEIQALIDSIESQLQSANLKLAPADYRALIDSLNQAKTQLTTLSPFKALSQGMTKYISSLKDLRKAQKDNLSDKEIKNYKAGVISAAQEVTASIGQISQTTSSIGGTIAGVADSFGADGRTSAIIEGVTGALSGVGKAAGGVGKIMSGDLVGGITDVISGIGDFIISLNGMSDAMHEENIKELQEQIDSLTDAYEDLADAVSKAFGSNATELIEEQNRNLEEQIALLEQQKEEEEAKKKTDDDAIDEYNDQIRENKKLIEENKEAAVDALFGEDVQSAISNLAEGIASAWASGESAAKGAKDTVKSMLQDMITTAIKAYIQASGAMERIRETMQQAMADDIITDAEYERIEQQAQQIADEVERKYGWASKLYEDEEEREAATKSSLGASQESVDESNGRLTAIQGITYDIREEQKAQGVILSDLRADSASILDEIMGIHDDTSEMRAAFSDVRAMVKEIRSNVGTMTDRGVKML